MAPDVLENKLIPFFVDFTNGNIPEDTIIWRYMSWEKFEYLLKNKKLYMSSPIGFEQDNHEGFVPHSIRNYIKKIVEIYYDNIIIPPGQTINLSGITVAHGKKNKYRDIQQLLIRAESLYKFCKKRFYISCWTKGDIDQDVMWRSYIPGNEHLKTGIAIQTTVKDLKASLLSNMLFAINNIEYVDFEELSEKISKEDAHNQLIGGMYGLARTYLLKKRKHFMRDNEVRLLTDTFEDGEDALGRCSLFGNLETNYDIQPETKFIEIPIDIAILINKIVLSPTSDFELLNKTKILLKENNIDNIEIYKSKITNKEENFF